MLDRDRGIRDRDLVNMFYLRLAGLGSSLNSRISGGPLYTLILAFITMVSDAFDDCLALFQSYSPSTSTGAIQKQVLGFFGLTPFASTSCAQTFTVIRSDASSPLVIPDGAVIQTQMDSSGKVRSYRVQVGDGITIAAGTYFAHVIFQALEVGSKTTISTPMQMQIASGVSGSGVYVFSGRLDTLVSNPLSTLSPTYSIASWLIDSASSFSMASRLLGRDPETDTEYYQRCISRWDEQAVGSTAASYEAWAMSYLDLLTGNSPVVAAKVTGNQIFSLGCVAPSSQYLLINQEYIMGVEVAVAFRNTVASPSDLSLIANHLMMTRPHTDRVWVRPINPVFANLGFCSIVMKGPASFVDQVFILVSSFFVYNSDHASNYQGLGSQIYKAEIIYAIKQLSPLIENVKVVFVLPGRLTSDGDIDLLPYDQIVMASPSSSIHIQVV